jgi:hypothetical protein
VDCAKTPVEIKIVISPCGKRFSFPQFQKHKKALPRQAFRGFSTTIFSKTTKTKIIRFMIEDRDF